MTAAIRRSQLSCKPPSGSDANMPTEGGLANDDDSCCQKLTANSPTPIWLRRQHNQPKFSHPTQWDWPVTVTAVIRGSRPIHRFPFCYDIQLDINASPLLNNKCPHSFYLFVLQGRKKKIQRDTQHSYMRECESITFYFKLWRLVCNHCVSTVAVVSAGGGFSCREYLPLCSPCGISVFPCTIFQGVLPWATTSHSFREGRRFRVHYSRDSADSRNVSSGAIVSSHYHRHDTYLLRNFILTSFSS